VSLGIPRKIEWLMKMTLEGAKGKVIVDGKISNPFVMSREVMHRDVLCATLFNVGLQKALKNLEQSNTVVNRLTQIYDYGDDILVIARSLPALEAMCAEISKEAGRVGLVINPNKTKYMRLPASPSLRISDRCNHKR